MLLLSIFAHHSEPGDPILLDWIKHQIDALVGLGPLAIVLGLGLIVVAIPIAIMVVYVTQRVKYGG